MTKADDLIQSPALDADAIRSAVMRDLHVALPGIVKSFRAEDQTAEIQPALRRTEGGELVSLPLLLDVPVFFPGGSMSALTWPVQAGDECLVIFADGCIDAWLQHGGISNAISVRRHDYSDGFAFVGFRSRPNRIVGFPDRPCYFGGLHPVGTVYTTTLSSFNPAQEFGGTWQLRPSAEDYVWVRTA